ncbi:hypothetical protein J3R80_14595 [Aliiroseovarius sp. Z3]|uniref:DUF5666 domain-containing protein n=1 Tax=Aliiroseovarius sp. Z3 TaxID=2811402 RepID=UPI0023B24F33|nr:DUF5666 domain-containing protein [Aliiroseovarius sp. Z3]MDE9451700.1 hypothetical protein [Aliiroseovarius sp. Z3]
MSLLRIVLSAVLSLVLAGSLLANDDGEREGGILGTGIVGTITELGSIYVNGQHIRVAPDSAVTDGVTVSAARQLLPGHTVAVVATPDGDGWQASYIRQITPLVGPIQRLSDTELSVMGTVVLADRDMTAAYATGDWIAVSGLWKGEQVVASRVEPASPNGPARIEGNVFDIAPGQPLTIGGTEITSLVPSHIQDGDVVRAVGAASESELRADRLETGVFAETQHVVFSEGYFSVPKPSGIYALLGSGIVSYTDNPEMIDPTAKQFVCASNARLFSTSADQLEAEDMALVLTECLSNADGP